MKNILLLFSLLLISGMCLGQRDSLYTLSINFAPSFIYTSSLTVNVNGKEGYVEFKFDKDNRDKATIKNSDLLPLTNFLKTYKYRIKDNVDTVGIYTQIIDGKTDTMYDITAGSDGVTVNGSLIQTDRKRAFAFWSPKKGTENDKFMGIIFRLMETHFSKDSTINYIEALKDYFPHDLIVRRLSIYPLRYKWYGFIGSNVSNSTEAFLKALPLHQKVFIDLSQVNGFSADMYDAIEDYSKLNRNIYWITPNPRVLKGLYDTEIPHTQIIFEKK